MKYLADMNSSRIVSYRTSMYRRHVDITKERRSIGRTWREKVEYNWQTYG